MSQQYTDKIKSEFGPVLTFFGVTPSGNLFKDITNLSVRENITKQTLYAIENTKLDEKLTKYFFEAYDTDKNGVIDRTEFKKLVVDIGIAMQDDDLQNISDAQVEDAFKLLDENQSNAIDWSEFKKWFDDLMKADEQQAAATENVAE